MALPSDWKVRVEQLLSLMPSVRLILCYGSRWAGIATPESDYDMIVIGNKMLSLHDVAHLRRQVKQRLPDVDWHWLSVRGARANRLINPTLSWAMRTGYVVGDPHVLGPEVPVPISTLRSTAQDVLDDLNALHRLDDPWDGNGLAFRQLAKRVVVLDQILAGVANSLHLSREVQLIMQAGNPEQAIRMRAQAIIDQTVQIPPNAGDVAFHEAIHG